MLARLFDAAKRTRAELTALGRALRSETPRQSHADFRPDPARPDPIALLRAQDAPRVPELVALRYGRMLASPLAFYRGAAAVMAWDLARSPATGVHVQACGDAHLLNFGAYASAERRVVFDIIDFDETLPAPFEYDVKRLAASALLDARELDYGDALGLDAVEAGVHRYCSVIDDLSRATSLDIHHAHASAEDLLAEAEHPEVERALRRSVAKARRRTHLQAFQKLVTSRDGELRFVEDPPLLVRLSDDEVERFHALFNTYRSTLQTNRRHLLEQYRFRDAARKVVGIGSVGLRAYVVLLQGRGDPDPLLIQIKEAVSSVLTPYVGRSGYERHGERVVVGQRLMQATSDPFLGWAPFAERDYYVRQLRDMKGRPEDHAPSARVFCAYVERCGAALARAHARSVDPAVLRGYLGKGAAFAQAIAAFAGLYADQTERDRARLGEAVAAGEVEAQIA
jgi:uncharacterized protein (DUF2252 family)